MRKLFGFAGLLIILLVLVILGNTFLMTSKQAPAVPAMDIRVDRDRAAQHLSSAVQFQTVSHGDPALDQAGEFSGLHRYLEQTYPAVHRVLTREVVGGSSLLYTWQGRDPALKPILLLAHMDVVPVEPGTEGAWTYPPFEGRIAEGYVWGRGALDDKSALIGILEAVEMLVAEGFQPERTIYLGSGHDEEAAQAGAYAMAQLLLSRGVELEYVLDEGLSITEGVVPSLSQPAALIGSLTRAMPASSWLQTAKRATLPCRHVRQPSASSAPRSPNWRAIPCPPGRTVPGCCRLGIWRHICRSS